jgi:hypothetical protein
MRGYVDVHTVTVRVTFAACPHPTTVIALFDVMPETGSFTFTRIHAPRVP